MDKKKGNCLFGVNMDTYDRAEVWELVCVSFLYRLSPKYNRTNMSLYHGDAVAILRNIGCPKSGVTKLKMANKRYGPF